MVSQVDCEFNREIDFFGKLFGGGRVRCRVTRSDTGKGVISYLDWVANILATRGTKNLKRAEPILTICAFVAKRL